MNEPHYISQPGPFRWWSIAMNRYAEFQGRSSRAEFWSFTIITIVVILFLGAIGFFVPFLGWFFFLPICGIFVLVTLIPSIAVTVRRLHDTGRSGFWYFWSLILQIVPIVPALLSEVVPIDMQLLQTMVIVSNIGSVMLFLCVLVFCFLDSDYNPNKYGPSPKPLPSEDSAPAHTYPGQ